MSITLTSRFFEMNVALTLSILNFISLVPLVYIFLYYLIPKFWEKKKYVTFFTCGFAVVIVSAFIRVWLIHTIILYVAGSIEMLGQDGVFFQFAVEVIFTTLLATPLRMVDVFIKKAKLENELQTQALKSEIRFLKAQVNPHFLFNALNNIYSLAFTKSDLTAEMILRLSDMMSYMLYDTNVNKVSLDSEVQYIQNYLALHALKKDNSQQFELVIEGDTASVEVVPMLFIPFFENAIKHGDLHTNPKGKILSTVKVTDAKLFFQISNTFKSKTKNTDQKGGIGLTNIKQRLDILYPEKHHLKTHVFDNVFRVDLEIVLEESNNSTSEHYQN